MPEIRDLRQKVTAAKAEATAARNAIVPPSVPAASTVARPVVSASSSSSSSSMTSSSVDKRSADILGLLLRYRPARIGVLAYLGLMHFITMR